MFPALSPKNATEPERVDAIGGANEKRPVAARFEPKTQQQIGHGMNVFLPSRLRLVVAADVGHRRFDNGRCGGVGKGDSPIFR